MHPLKTSNHATTTLTAVPAAIGEAIARIPTAIMSTLSPIDHPTDFFTNVAADVGSIRLLLLPSVWSEDSAAILLMVRMFSAEGSSLRCSFHQSGERLMQDHQRRT